MFLSDRQAPADDGGRSQGALDAALRRICNYKPGSGKLEVSQEIHKQWAAGGSSRRALMDLLVKVKGDKDQHVQWKKVIHILNAICEFVQYCWDISEGNNKTLVSWK